jgi:hypothetical protein
MFLDELVKDSAAGSTDYSQRARSINGEQQPKLHGIPPIFWHSHHTCINIQINVRPFLPWVVLKRVLWSQTQVVDSKLAKPNQNRVHAARSQGPRKPKLAKFSRLPTHDEDLMLVA